MAMQFGNTSIQFTKGNLFQIRTVGLKDFGDRDQGGNVIFKAGEPRGVPADMQYTGIVEAIAPFKGEWLCQLADGRLARVHNNKIVGNEALYVDKAKSPSQALLDGAAKDMLGKPVAKAADPIKALQAARARKAELEAQLRQLTETEPMLLKAAQQHAAKVAEDAAKAAQDAAALLQEVEGAEEPTFEKVEQQA